MSRVSHVLQYVCMGFLQFVWLPLIDIISSVAVFSPRNVYSVHDLYLDQDKSLTESEQVRMCKSCGHFTVIHGTTQEAFRVLGGVFFKEYRVGSDMVTGYFLVR